MTPRQRLLAVLRNEPVDRTPIWLLFPYHKAGYYVDVRTNPCYTPVFEASKGRCIMLDRRNPGCGLFGPEVESHREELTEDGWEITRHSLSHGGRTLRAETRRKGHHVLVRKLLESEDDLDTLLSFPINADPGRIAAAMEKHATQYMAERADFPADYGAMMLDMGEPIGFLYGNSNLEEYAMWSLSASDKVVAFLDRAMEVYRQAYRYTLERDWAEVYFLVGSELASPPMVSRQTFQKWIVPYARELIEMIHARGKYAIQHYHGQIKLILEDFLTMGPDALHTIESPPTGNCTLTEAFNVVGDRIALIGNVQYDLFRSLSADQMKDEVRRVLDEVAGRRFILSPSAGPYEQQVAASVTENYLAFIGAGWNYRFTG